MLSYKTLDSYINKIQFGFDKTLYTKNKKEVIYNSSVALSDYVHNSNKDYWSGIISVKYKWGSYRNLKYSLRHLNSYYLRHYIDRDLSLNDLKPCSFTDNDQYLSISNRINSLVTDLIFINSLEPKIDSGKSYINLEGSTSLGNKLYQLSEDDLIKIKNYENIKKIIESDNLTLVRYDIDSIQFKNYHVINITSITIIFLILAVVFILLREKN